MRTIPLRLSFLLLLTGTVACAPDPVIGPPPETDPALATYAPNLQINIATFTRTGTGLYYKDVPAGWGSIAADSGDTVVVDYTGYLTDGRIFDGSRVTLAATPVTWVVGVSELIPGFTQGLKGVRAGGKRRLIIPPALGYGPAGTATIPGNAILVFDLIIHGVRPRARP
jgi:FKBP-type peptidyl-prolyl cis-trans isomerase FkpA